jgi:hypothetical protein
MAGGVQKARENGADGVVGADICRRRALTRLAWHGPSTAVSFDVAYRATISFGVWAKIARAIVVVGHPQVGGAHRSGEQADRATQGRSH